MEPHDHDHDRAESAASRLAAAFNRRRLLQGFLGAGASYALAACGSSAVTASSTSAAGPAKRGGTLRVALSGGSTADTIDAQAATAMVDNARNWQLYNSLVEFDLNAIPQLSLADEITPSRDATKWTVRLKPGVTFHNGKDVTADDVVFSFQRILNPKKLLQGAAAISLVNAGGIRKLDQRTVEIPCHSPFASLFETLACYYYGIVPMGYDPKAPVGTGPFKFQSFTPGQQSTFVRNENYWESGLPYLDTLVISDFQDETSQINALISGQVDAVDALSSAGLDQVSSGSANTLISNGGGFTPFTMRVDTPPFDDVRVRQAFKLLVNRQQMLELVFGGHGTIGNDVVAIWDPAYNHALPQRTQNIAQAKQLLAAAGHTNLQVQLVTADIAQGVVKAAQVFAQQASEAGVTVTVRQVTVDEFFGTNYLKWPFAQDYWFYAPYLPQAALGFLPSSPYNETHWNDSQYEALYRKALSETDTATRAATQKQMQQIEYDTSGYIIPYFPPALDAYSTRLHGFTPSKTGLPLSNFGFKRAWFS